MIYPLVRGLAAAGAPIRVPVAVTCRVLKIARQPYYRWLAQPVTDAEWVQAHRANALFDAHHEDLEFGHRLLADEVRELGRPMADPTAWRICDPLPDDASVGRLRTRMNQLINANLRFTFGQ